MDEFGVLTEKYGLKPQGKAAPMASSKRPTNAGDSQTGKFGTNSSLNPKSSQDGSRSHQHSTFDYGSFLDDHGGDFRSSSNKKTQDFMGLDVGIDDIFGVPNKSNVGNGGSFGFVDDIFGGSTSSTSNGYVDDIFGGMPGLNSSPSAKADHGLSGFASPPKQSVAIDDLLDKIGALHASKSPNGKRAEGLAKKAPDFDDLIPGFGGSRPTNNGRASTEMNKPRKPTVALNKPAVTSHDDPFLVFEKASSTASSESFLDSLEQISKSNNFKGTRGSSSISPSLRSSPKPMNVSNSNEVHNSSVSSIDELEDFAMGRVQHNARRRANIHTDEIKQNLAAKTSKSKEPPTARVNQSNDMDDLESFFSMGSRSSSAPKSRSTTLDHTFDHQMRNKGRPEMSERVPSGSLASMKKSSQMTSLDDLSLIFGGSPSSEFEEIEGETEERRKARLGRHQRTQERAAKAVADMNQRDFQTKMEQEERRRIADTADVKIKRWAAGKEGNMRALLSSLQQVLWPECGWQPVSLTDMITSASVKKVYRKATLCIHPDKVQQKGANLEQKYTAEKVFDLLKEAWGKFNAEELS